MEDITEKQSLLFRLEGQKQEISLLTKKPLKAGDKWYVIDVNWFKKWKSYVGYELSYAASIVEDSLQPGPIDNTSLCEIDRVKLKFNKNEHQDFILIPEEAWMKFVDWYGVMDGPVSDKGITGTVIEQGIHFKRCIVELHLLELRLCCQKNLERLIMDEFSRSDTVGHLRNRMRQLFNIEEDEEVRVWNQLAEDTFELLNDMNNSIQDVCLYSGQIILIESRNLDGTWPRANFNPEPQSEQELLPVLNEQTANTSNIEDRLSTSSVADVYDGRLGNVQPGLCGLSNLGNTCFMNSTIQCLSNIFPLTEYMQNIDRWEQDLNTDNPFGMNGDIATAYAHLITVLWSGKYVCASPRNFKTVISKFKQEFGGSEQHDAHELMAFLLDGLHEDLNRIQNKPNTEAVESDGRPDEVVAQETWMTYKMRNDSIIIDIFHGLLKSTLVCPMCRTVSVKFDPFCYLSLPLPSVKQHIDVFLIRLDPSLLPRKIRLTVSEKGTMQDLCRNLQLMTNIPLDNMLVINICENKISRTLCPNDSISCLHDTDAIFVFECPQMICPKKKLCSFPVYFRVLSPDEGWKLFAIPTVIFLPLNEISFDIIYRAVIARIARFIRIKPKKEINLNFSDQNLPPPKRPKDEGFYLINDGRLFQLSSGTFRENSLEYDPISDNGEYFQVPDNVLFAADWDMERLQQFYDRDTAEDVEREDSVNASQSKKTLSGKLSDCLDLFAATEHLGKDDLWHCPSCRSQQQATKKFDLWQLPQILIFHLKRFLYSHELHRKIDDSVCFPIRNLNMNPWVINRNHSAAIYDLIAVSNHLGSVGSGHYTTYAKSKIDDRWYLFDDSKVVLISETQLISKFAYILVYKLRPLTGGEMLTHRHAASSLNATSAMSSSVNTTSTTPSSSSLSSEAENCSDVEMDVNINH